MSSHTAIPSAQDHKDVTLSGVLLRIIWMVLGFAALFFGGIAVFRQRGAFGTPDVFYGALVPFLLLVRYLDIRFCGGKTVDLEPATMRHWAGYAWRLVLGAVVFWAIAHVGGAAVVTPPESASTQEGSR